MNKPPPPPLSFDPIYMEDAQFAESNEKQFSDFYFSSYREKFIENWDDDVTKWPKNDHNS